MARTKRGTHPGGSAKSAAAGADSRAADEQPSASGPEALSTPPNESPSVNSIALAHQTRSPTDPNSSPSSAPTETPASTPARPAVQRFASGLSESSKRGSPSRGRFKPRAIRRDKDEREKMEKEEQARINARVAEFRAQAGPIPASRGGLGRGDVSTRGRRGRGRGDAMGKGRLAASGLFSVAPAAAEKKAPPRIASPIGSLSRSVEGVASGSGAKANASGTVTRFKQESAPFSIVSKEGPRHIFDLDVDMDIKTERPEPSYPWEQDGSKSARRVEVQHINEDSDSDDKPLDSRPRGRYLVSSNGGGLKPVALHRQEHKKRITTVNTEPVELEDSDYEVDDDDTRAAAAGGRRLPDRLGLTHDGNNEIKNSPDPDADAMDVDSGFNADGLSSHLSIPTAKLKSARRLSGKDKKPVLQTEEEKAEYRRHEIDLKVLSQELNNLHSGRANDSDGEEEKVSTGRLYLFQFPPILPPLLNADEVREQNGDGKMKDDRTAPTATSKAAISTPEEAIVLKVDPDTEDTRSRPELFKEEGYIGKLVVRESGKVELDWGGTSLQLGRGAEVDFLTTTMVLNEQYGASMGPIMGKFIATPDWSKMFDME